jgi:uncharacterized protein YunC (DUF1805 family)
MYTAFPTELEGVLHVWMTDEAFCMCGSLEVQRLEQLMKYLDL